MYQDHLRNFKLVIRDGGRIQIAKNPFSENLKESCILLDIIFSNHGARSGVIEDIAICLHSQDKSTIFRSLLTVIDRVKNFQKELSPPKTESFISFELGKKESVVKQILFIPIERLVEDSFYFEVGRYIADIWVISSKKDKWIKYFSITFDVTNEDIIALDKSNVVSSQSGGVFVKWMTVLVKLNFFTFRMSNCL